MKLQLLAAIALLASVGCPQEQATVPETEVDADTDTDADADTDTDVDTDTEPDDDDTQDKANEIVPEDLSDSSIDPSARGTLNPAGDRDWYVWDGTLGVTYMVYLDGDGVPDPGMDGSQDYVDTVARIYEPDGDLVVEVDDLPYWEMQMNSGVMVRGMADEPMYLEVLEWSDAYGDEPNGSPDYDYDLYVVDMAAWGIGESNRDDNDTIEEAAANAALEEWDWWSSPWSVLDEPPDTSPSFAIGEIDGAGDVDTLFRSYTDPTILQLSFHPSLVTDLDPVVSVFDAEGNLLAQTSNPFHGADDWSIMTYDAGITCPIPRGGDYFVQIADASGEGSPTHWYTLMASSWYFYSPTIDEEDYGESPEFAQYVNMLQGTNDEEYWYGNPYGRMDDESDLVDWYRVEEGVDAGRYFNLRVETTHIGSILVDPIVTVYASDGLTVLAQSSDPDVHFEDLYLEENGPLYFTIESNSGIHGPGAYYLASVQTWSEPLYE